MTLIHSYLPNSDIYYNGLFASDEDDGGPSTGYIQYGGSRTDDDTLVCCVYPKSNVLYNDWIFNM